MRTALLVLVALLVSAPVAADTIQPDAMIIFENRPLSSYAPGVLSGSIGWTDDSTAGRSVLGGHVLLDTMRFTFTDGKTYENLWSGWMETIAPWRWYEMILIPASHNPSEVVELILSDEQPPESCCVLARGEYSTDPSWSQHVVDVPAPSTLALLGAGLVPLAVWWRIRR